MVQILSTLFYILIIIFISITILLVLYLLYKMSQNKFQIFRELYQDREWILILGGVLAMIAGLLLLVFITLIIINVELI